MEKTKVIIDCDAGVDDALAMILALHSPELEVEAITAVNGNVPLDLVFENIKKVLCLVQPTERPQIAKGASRPLRGYPVYAFPFHGDDGLGGARVGRTDEDAWWRSSTAPAHQLIPQLARRFPGQMSLIATGPLTNLALALQEDPEGMRKLGEVVIMGGAVRTRGNITPHAEFNIHVDPMAAKIVMESELPITLVPLDVTHHVDLTPQIMEQNLRVMKTRFSEFAIEATGYDFAARRFRINAEAFHLHDPLAVAVAVDRSLVKTEALALEVETEEGPYYGKTAESSQRSLGQQKIDVCLEVDGEGFLDLFLTRLKGSSCRPA